MDFPGLWSPTLDEIGVCIRVFVCMYALHTASFVRQAATSRIGARRITSYSLAVCSAQHIHTWSVSAQSARSSYNSKYTHYDSNQSVMITHREDSNNESVRFAITPATHLSCL